MNLRGLVGSFLDRLASALLSAPPRAWLPAPSQPQPFPSIGPACISSPVITVFITSLPGSGSLQGSSFPTTWSLKAAVSEASHLFFPYLFGFISSARCGSGSRGLEIMEFLYTHHHPSPHTPPKFEIRIIFFFKIFFI